MCGDSTPTLIMFFVDKDVCDCLCVVVHLLFPLWSMLIFICVVVHHLTPLCCFLIPICVFVCVWWFIASTHYDLCWSRSVWLFVCGGSPFRLTMFFVDTYMCSCLCMVVHDFLPLWSLLMPICAVVCVWWFAKQLVKHHKQKVLYPRIGQSIHNNWQSKMIIA